MRLGLFEHIVRVLRRNQITKWTARDLETKDGWEKFYGWIKANQPSLKAQLDKYEQVGAAYDFDFNILEHNHLEASLGFKNPLTSSAFDLSAGGAVDASRRGQRTFKAQETFGQLVLRDHFCGEVEPRDENLAYPVTGSIGLRKVVETFVEISESKAAARTALSTP